MLIYNFHQIKWILAENWVQVYSILFFAWVTDIICDLKSYMRLVETNMLSYSSSDDSCRHPYTANGLCGAYRWECCPWLGHQLCPPATPSLPGEPADDLPGTHHHTSVPLAQCATSLHASFATSWSPWWSNRFLPPASGSTCVLYGWNSVFLGCSGCFGETGEYKIIIIIITEAVLVKFRNYFW